MKTIRLLFLAITTYSLTAPVKSISPKRGWMKDDQSRKQYYVYPSNVTVLNFSQGRKLCKEIGGFLPEPKTAAENDFLSKLVDLYAIGFFLGLSDIKTEGVWLWDTDSSHVTWFDWGPKTDWYPVEPNGDTRQNCAVLTHASWAYANWADVECDGFKSQDVVCEGVCPIDFILLGAKCYQYVGEGKDWTQAANHCQSLGGYLAEPQSASEYQYIKTLVQDNGVPYDVYIGGKLIAGEWTWVRSNDVITYLPWSPPNPSGNGECLSLWRERDYGLDDSECDNSQAASVCEIAPDINPGGAALDVELASGAGAAQSQAVMMSALLGLVLAFL